MNIISSCLSKKPNGMAMERSENKSSEGRCSKQLETFLTPRAEAGDLVPFLLDLRNTTPSAFDDILLAPADPG